MEWRNDPSLPRTDVKLLPGEVEGVKRLITSFQIFKAFVFDISERHLFPKIIRKIGLEPLVTVREASRKRPHVYVILLDDRPCLNECRYSCREYNELERNTCLNNCINKCLDKRLQYLIDVLGKVLEYNNVQ